MRAQLVRRVFSPNTMVAGPSAPAFRERTPVPEATARAKELLAKVGLSHREDAYPHEMSGGEQQRVAIARALAMEPDALLLDEPTSALDPERVGEVLDVLQALAADGLTMLVVTHEMRTVQKVADRIVMLYPLSRLVPGDGQVLFDGTPEQLRDCDDPRVRQFVEGEARDRLEELARQAE